MDMYKKYILPPFFFIDIPLKAYVREKRTKKIEKRNNTMKKSILISIMLLAFCLIAGAAMADTYSTDQMNQPPMNGPQMNGGQNGQMQGQPPMNGPQMNGGQNGQMQGQPPMNLAVVDTDDAETVSLFADADTDSDVLETIENGAVAEILEEDGDYVKVSINGTIGYVLNSALSELKPGGGQEPPAKPEVGSEPPAKPENGQQPPAKPEDGQNPPTKPENGQQPPAKPEDDQEPPAKPENGQQPPAKPEDDQEPPVKSGNGQQMTAQPDNRLPMQSQPELGSAGNRNSTLEPGLKNFFQAFLNFLTGKNANNQG